MSLFDMPEIIARLHKYSLALSTELWGAGMVICLDRGADLRMA